MSVINTNIKAEMAISALRMNERPLAVAMQQMSTGKRINSARDDAAGLAIANWMTTEVRSLNQAIRNSTDAISTAPTACRLALSPKPPALVSSTIWTCPPPCPPLARKTWPSTVWRLAFRNQKTTSCRHWPTGNTVPLPGQRPSMPAKSNLACGPLFSPIPFRAFLKSTSARQHLALLLLMDARVL